MSMLQARELDVIHGVEVYRVLKVMLSDGKWYDVNSRLGGDFSVYGNFGNKPQYFTLACEYEVALKDGSVGVGLKRISGLASEIKLIEEELS